MFDLEPYKPVTPFYGLLSVIFAALSLLLGFVPLQTWSGLVIKIVCHGLIIFGPVVGIGSAAVALSRHEQLRWLAYSGAVLSICQLILITIRP